MLDGKIKILTLLPYIIARKLNVSSCSIVSKKEKKKKKKKEYCK